MAPKDPPADVPLLPMPSRNPMPLSATQESQIRDIYNKRVKEFCTDEVKAFAACASGRTVTIAFSCRDPLRLMNGCMKKHATQAQEDAAREEWFATRLQRQRDRERKQIKKAAQEDFMREWWGLSERDEASKKKIAERQARLERVGGLTGPSDKGK